MKIARGLACLGLFSTLLLASANAEAQNAGFALNRFEPSERGSHWFVMESLDFRGMARPAFGVVGDYQYRPLAIYDKNGDVRSQVIGHQLTTHVGGSLVIAETLRFAVNMPIVPYVEGEQGRLDGVTYTPPASSPTVGDLRFGFDLKLFGQGEDAIAAAIGAQAWVPTGDQASYQSDGTFRGAPRLLIAGSPGIFTYAVKAGVMLRADDAKNFANSPVGHDFIYGASAGVRLADRRLVIGPEAYGSTVLTEQTFKTRTTPFEILMGARYMCSCGLRFGAGAGPGITRGYGSPVVRVVGVIEWSPEIEEKKPEPKPEPPPPPKPADRDNDGILDSEDACPDVPGVRTDDPRTNGCADKDGDGIYDPLDACVDVPGLESEDPKLNGCPDPDRDKDGVPNAEDACPDVAGIKTSDPKTNGCPDPDRDKDGVANEQDACPDEPGKPDPDPKKNGCPKAFVAQGQIKILDQVKFKTGSAQILPGKDSEEVLQAVLKVLQDHPEITKLRVEGHTDNTGSAKINTKLSADRAASVVKWLTNKGIAKERLTSQGFGPDKPIDSNTTEEGRRNNRRVEFHIESPPSPEAPKP
jgi:outer membrane protein OmpA-like peptidoglycan-associated protein